MAERSFEVSDFDSIKLSGRHAVIVTTGAEESVRAEGDEASLDGLEVTCSGGVLSIGSRRRGLFGLGRSRDRAATLRVTMQELRKAAVAGSGGIRVDRVAGDAFDGAIAGSGDLAIDELDVAAARFRIAGSGCMKAAGRAQYAGMRIAGSGDGDLSALIAEEAEISVAGSGDVKAHATKAARIRLAGSGDVAVTGGAQCSVKKAGSGDVRCS